MSMLESLQQTSRPLVTHLEEVTPGKGKKKLHLHEESNFERQIITSSLD